MRGQKFSCVECGGMFRQFGVCPNCRLHGSTEVLDCVVDVDGTPLEFSVLGDIPQPVIDALNDTAGKLPDGSRDRLIIENWARLMNDDVLWRELGLPLAKGAIR